MFVALDEIVSNAVKHARPDNAGRMRLDLAMRGGLLAATFQDDGPAFNPLTMPRPRIDQPLHERPIGGLGLLLVGELMDAVRYARHGDWNRVVLKRKL